MGLLHNPRTGRTFALGGRVLAGRGGACALRIDSRVVSNEHAAIWWEDGTWNVRDTGSRNGTTLDGRPLTAGERVTIGVGARLVFGHEEHTWELVDAGPPVAVARGDDGRLRQAEGGVLCLPDAEAPRVMVFEASDGRWVAEGDGEPVVVRDGDPVAVDGRAWVLHLPTGDVATWATDAQRPALVLVSLRFRVSKDEEYIEVWLEHGAVRAQLPSRAHHELMLLLARARLEDVEAAPAEQGWRYADEVQRMIATDPGRFNVLIFRARQQLGEAGVAGAASVIERRASTGQLRLGVERVVVEGL